MALIFMQIAACWLLVPAGFFTDGRAGIRGFCCLTTRFGRCGL
jgi:hypothetical protein